MSIPVYTITSDLGHEVRAPWLEKAGNCLEEGLKEVSLAEYLQSSFALLFVASGGSENAFLEFADRIRNRPVYLLTSGESNSLAASMEILSYLCGMGRQGEILHGKPENVADRIMVLSRVSHAKERLKGSMLGCVGKPSDWLISSPLDDSVCREKLGIRFEQIPMDELLCEYDRGGYSKDGRTEELLRRSFDRAETEKALRLYGALDRVAALAYIGALALIAITIIDGIPGDEAVAMGVLLTMP